MGTTTGVIVGTASTTGGVTMTTSSVTTTGTTGQIETTGNSQQPPATTGVQEPSSTSTSGSSTTGNTIIQEKNPGDKLSSSIVIALSVCFLIMFL
jgi:hypothetical protein